MSLQLTVLTPERKLVDHVEIAHVTLTGSEGEIQILPGHAAMVGTLETGRFAYSTAHNTAPAFNGFIASGFFEVSGDEVAVVAEVLELAGEINVERAKAAEAKALEKLQSKDLSLELIEKYQRKLRRARLRQSLAKKQ